MKIIKEFKEFALRGNVVDLAIGVIIGGAFGKIITSLVNDIIMPPISVLTGGVRFNEMKIVLGSASETAPAATLNYGAFIQTTFDFLLVALCIFLMIKGMNALKRKQASEPTPVLQQNPQEKLLTEIRDILKERK